MSVENQEDRREPEHTSPLPLTSWENDLVEAIESTAAPSEAADRALRVAAAAYIRSEFRLLRQRDEEIMRRLSRIESLLEKEDDEITRRLIAIEAAVCTEPLVLEPETAHE